ncbi:MAG TPA: hypothetical protein VFM06_07085 [Candidatus Limnocylindria bacterium]|nr:hypothetical protein [Candidatus Limnocylindria bacterium]
MSFRRGLVAGAAISALYVLAGHLAMDTERTSVAGSDIVATAVFAVLVPLALVWGWTWVSDRWSGRSGPRLLLFTLGLAVATAAAFPIDGLVFPDAPAHRFSALPVLAVDGILFVLPVVGLAAVLYWAFGSGKLPLRLATLATGYLVALPLGLLFPPAAMGIVAGTAAGHSWRAPGARVLISTLVISLMLIASIELPLAAAAVAEATAR